MKIFKILTALAAFFAVAVLSGCDDDKRPEPDPQPVKLASPEIVFKDVKPTSFAACQGPAAPAGCGRCRHDLSRGAFEPG